MGCAAVRNENNIKLNFKQNSRAIKFVIKISILQIFISKTDGLQINMST
jgi:hypothetical protein